MHSFASDDRALDRTSEWFVPRFGPDRFRRAVGLLFLPYTGMVLSFATMGSLLGRVVYWDRVLALAVIYFLGLGIAAHALDGLGSRGTKPWGEAFGRAELWAWALGSLALAYAIAGYYMVHYVPLLWTVAALEGFFVFAYNLESFGGRFHTDRWFAFSWGFLPVQAGYLMQTNTLSAEAIVVGSAAGLLSYVEILVSRPYKELRRRAAGLAPEEAALMNRLENVLRSLSFGVLLLGAGLLLRGAAQR